MVSDNHYHSLKGHITNLLSGLSRYKEELPEELSDKISEDFYEAALESLEKRKKKLEKREGEYLRAVEKFNEDYELIRKAWKKDVIRLKRSLPDKEVLPLFGIRITR